MRDSEESKGESIPRLEDGKNTVEKGCGPDIDAEETKITQLKAEPPDQVENDEYEDDLNRENLDYEAIEEMESRRIDDCS